MKHFLFTIFIIISLSSCSVLESKRTNETSSNRNSVFEYPEAPPVDDILPLVTNLMLVDEDCLLPCFWEFHIGENSEVEVYDFVLETFRQVPYISLNNERGVSNNLLDPSTQEMDFYQTFLPLSSENGGNLNVIFRFIDNVLVRMDIEFFKAVNWLDVNPFTLSELLHTYGEPTDVYLRYSPAPTIGYALAVAYGEHGFIVEYVYGSNASAEERLTNEGQLLVCNVDPTNDLIYLTLQLDGQPIPLIETIQPPIDDESVFRPYWNIEDMAGLSIEEFTKFFVRNPEGCIEIYSLSDLREQGYGG